MNAVSLFAGIGGIDLALERAGIPVVAAVELDPACRAKLAEHFPHAVLFDDVTKVTGDDLLAAGLVPDDGLLAAGWPCQDNSVAGRRKGMAGPRSGLWRHVVRLLAETRPAWFLGENVPGLLSVNGGRDFATCIDDLAGLGMGFAWRVLDAQHFGVPQRRRRVFIVGRAGDARGPVQVLLEPESSDRHPAPGGEARPGTAAASDGGADVAGDVRTYSIYRDWRGDERGANARAVDVARCLEATRGSGQGGTVVVGTLQGGGRRGHRVDAESAAGGQLIAHSLTAEGFDASEDGTGCGTPLVVADTLRSHPRPGSNSLGAVAAPLTSGSHGDGVSAPGRRQEDDVNLVAFAHTQGLDEQASGSAWPTLTHNGMAVSAPAAAVRRLTPLECERLQGFPDNWTAGQSDSTRYRQLGNAVAVPCVEWITRRIAAEVAS